MDTVEKLQAENALLREALEFYAVEWEHDAEWIPTGPLESGIGEGRIGDIEPTIALMEDKGSVAKNALVKTSKSAANVLKVCARWKQGAARASDVLRVISDWQRESNGHG